MNNSVSEMMLSSFCCTNFYYFIFSTFQCSCSIHKLRVSDISNLRVVESIYMSKVRKKVGRKARTKKKKTAFCTPTMSVGLYNPTIRSCELNITSE